MSICQYVISGMSFQYVNMSLHVTFSTSEMLTCPYLIKYVRVNSESYKHRQIEKCYNISPLKSQYVMSVCQYVSMSICQFINTSERHISLLAYKYIFPVSKISIYCMSICQVCHFSMSICHVSMSICLYVNVSICQFINMS